MNTTAKQLEPDQLTLISVRDLENRMGMTRRVFYELEAQGEFPKRIPISHKNVCYFKEEVQQYLAVVQVGGKWSEYVAQRDAAAAQAAAGGQDNA